MTGTDKETPHRRKFLQGLLWSGAALTAAGAAGLWWTSGPQEEPYTPDPRLDAILQTFNDDSSRYPLFSRLVQRPARNPGGRLLHTYEFRNLPDENIVGDPDITLLCGLPVSLDANGIHRMGHPTTFVRLSRARGQEKIIVSPRLRDDGSAESVVRIGNRELTLRAPQIRLHTEDPFAQTLKLEFHALPRQIFFPGNRNVDIDLTRVPVGELGGWNRFAVAEFTEWLQFYMGADREEEQRERGRHLTIRLSQAQAREMGAQGLFDLTVNTPRIVTPQGARGQSVYVDNYTLEIAGIPPLELRAGMGLREGDRAAERWLRNDVSQVEGVHFNKAAEIHIGQFRLRTFGPEAPAR